MRAVVQRVRRAAVSVVSGGAGAEAGAGAGDGPGGEVVGEIGPGLCVLVGVTHDDDVATARRMADKLWTLRILDDDDGVMNRSIVEASGPGSGHGILVISQFTLYGDTTRGRRPSWIAAARPEHAEPLVDAVVERLRELAGDCDVSVATGRFRTEMRVEIVNDGPVTLVIDL